jgi:hypothetical protein
LLLIRIIRFSINISIWQLLIAESPAFAGGFSEYLKNYHLGVNLIGSNNQIAVNYELADGIPPADRCAKDPNGKMICHENLSDPGAGLGSEYLRGFGVFMQQIFKRQGFWYFNADVAFGALLLTGALPPGRSNDTLKEMVA